MMGLVRELLDIMTQERVDDFFLLIDLGVWDHELFDVIDDVKANYVENAHQKQVINRLWQRADQVTAP